MESNDLFDIEFAQPKTYDARVEIAAQCCTALEISMPLVVDAIDNRVEKAYGAFPDRLFIIDVEGKVAFKGGRGPFGFQPRQLERALVMTLLGQTPTDATSETEKIDPDAPQDETPAGQED